MPPLHINTITLSTFKEVLARYHATVPEKLRDLDAQRYDTIPAAVASRDESDKQLTKEEVEKLVEWKLKHGTFRPSLLGLVQSNSSQAVEETTKKAYAALWDSKISHPNTIPALKILVGLKGIGPATASLLLSVLRPAQMPFFSDEMFRWCCWDKEVKGKEAAGWQRKIKYNIKEYEMMLDGVEKLRMRLRKGLGKETDTSASALDVERVAWVLGKEGKDVGIVEEDGKKEGADDAEEQVEEAEEVQEVEIDDDVSSEEKATKPVAKKGTKRKAVEAKPRAEGTRKSTRTKK